MNVRRTVALIIVAGLPIAMLAGMVHLVQQAAPKTLYLHWCEPAVHPKKATRILSTPILLGKEIRITRDGGRLSLKGTIGLKDGKYQADLNGSFCTTTGFVNGTIELDKPFMPDIYAISSVCILMSFVLSTDPVGDEFLKESSWALPTGP